jgi:hypothetical protein
MKRSIQGGLSGNQSVLVAYNATTANYTQTYRQHRRKRRANSASVASTSKWLPRNISLQGAAWLAQCFSRTMQYSLQGLHISQEQKLSLPAPVSSISQSGGTFHFVVLDQHYNKACQFHSCKCFLATRRNRGPVFQSMYPSSTIILHKCHLRAIKSEARSQAPSNKNPQRTPQREAQRHDACTYPSGIPFQHRQLV